MKTIAWVIVAIVLIGGFLHWTNVRDAKLEIAVAKYVECVKVEYNTNPGAWYAEHGEYPYCNFNK